MNTDILPKLDATPEQRVDALGVLQAFNRPALLDDGAFPTAGDVRERAAVYREIAQAAIGEVARQTTQLRRAQAVIVAQRQEIARLRQGWRPAA